jgi:hypothetical protein
VVQKNQNTLVALELIEVESGINVATQPIWVDGPLLDLVLVEARNLSPRPGDPGPRRDPFSLMFLGPTAPVLPQRIYALENEAFGRLEIFLVPIGADADGVKYEAIFN